jgi:hypothetical protein
LDGRMELIEHRLDDAAIGWERMVEGEEEAARGK